MKKILVATLVLSMAMLTQGATLKWSANNIKYEGAAVSGGIAYLLATAQAGNVNYSLYTAETLKSEILSNSFDGSKAVASKATGTAGQISYSGIGNFNEGDSLSAIFVVFDGATIETSTKFMISGGPLTANWSSATGEQGVAFGNMSTGANVSADGWVSMGSVPEPTTIALLALGLAAVGLKRKVA